MRQTRLKTAIVAAFLLNACASNSYVVHPGSISTLDSKVFDTLLIAQAVIDQSRAELTAGTLPETLKPGLMRLIDSYNVARMSWLTYRNAVKSGASPTATAMNTAVSGLSAALDAFQSSRAIQ